MVNRMLISFDEFSVLDPEIWINDGRFCENGSCGYVLKPNRLI